MDQIDRYVLGLAVLEGDRDARKILADLLEEQGDRGLADWARKCKGKSNRRLDLVIMLLPCRSAIKLASQCVVKAAQNRQERKFAKDTSGAINAWYAGEIGVDRAVTLCQNALSKAPKNSVHMHNTIFRNRDDELRRLLVQGVENIGLATSAAESNPRLFHHFEIQVNQCVREAVKVSQQSISLSQAKESGLGGLEWQVALTKSVFNHLISPNEYSWPE